VLLYVFLKKPHEWYRAFPFIAQEKGLEYMGKDREKKEKKKEKNRREREGVLKLRHPPSPVGGPRWSHRR
jgi:hypothetical protein